MCSEVYQWLKSISSGLNLERLAKEFEIRGFSSFQSLKYLQKEDLDAFFPSPQKLLLAEKRILQEEINKLKEPNLTWTFATTSSFKTSISCSSSNTVVQRYIFKLATRTGCDFKCRFNSRNTTLPNTPKWRLETWIKSTDKLKLSG